LLFELSLVAGVVFDRWLLLSLLAEFLSERRGGGADWLCGCCCGRTLLASAAVLLSTRPAKISLPPCDESGAGRADFGGAFEKDTLVAASDVTLCTDGLSD
jgi:hypothetical protein